MNSKRLWTSSRIQSVTLALVLKFHVALSSLGSLVLAKPSSLELSPTASLKELSSQAFDNASEPMMARDRQRPMDLAETLNTVFAISLVSMVGMFFVFRMPTTYKTSMLNSVLNRMKFLNRTAPVAPTIERADSFVPPRIGRGIMKGVKRNVPADVDNAIAKGRDLLPQIPVTIRKQVLGNVPEDVQYEMSLEDNLEASGFFD